MTWNAKILNIALCTFLILGFQNCGPYNQQTTFSNADLSSQNPLDSGTPYEGKMFATLGPLCADGTEIQSRIFLTSKTKALLTRERCQEISPVTLTEADFKVDESSETLNYNGENFKFIGQGSQGLTQLAFSNDATQFYYSYSFEGTPSWLQIFLDTDNNPATGFYHNGIGADYLIENDYVWKYSAAAGDPQNTWAWSAHVSSKKNLSSQHVEWNFPRTSIGSPSLIKFIAQTSLGAKSSIVIQIPK